MIPLFTVNILTLLTSLSLMEILITGRTITPNTSNAILAHAIAEGETHSQVCYDSVSQIWLVIRWVLEIFSFFEPICNLRNFRNFWIFWNYDFLSLDLLLNKNCPASSWKGSLVISGFLGTLRYFTPSYISRQIKLRGNFRNFSNFYKNVQLHPEREFQ